MSKYRLLSLEELKELEQDFINYLILNGIAADDWERLKKEDKDAAENIVDLFSDVVFETIFRKVEYLEYRNKSEVISYQCLAEKMVLVGMRSSSEEVDFTRQEFIREAAQNPPEGLKIFTTEKKYTDQREVELFRLTESGCTIADGKLFKTLCLALPGLS